MVEYKMYVFFLPFNGSITNIIVSFCREKLAEYLFTFGTAISLKFSVDPSFYYTRSTSEQSLVELKGNWTKG